MDTIFSTSGHIFFSVPRQRWGKLPLARLSISAVQAPEKSQKRVTVPKQQQPSKKEIRQLPPPTTTSPRQEPSVAVAFCNALDDLINNFIDPSLLRPSVDPRLVLSDNWSPVPDLQPTNCPVIRGAIPARLGGGAYIRNGPNPQHLPRGPHHLFDGDGMLHSLLLPAGGGTSPATLTSRHVHTYKYLLERAAGAPVLPNVFSGFHGPAGIARGAIAAARILTGQMNPAAGVGLANTSLAFFGGRLYALGESDLPYAVQISPEDGDITTLGRWDFEGKVKLGMTAHPKTDPVTGETFAFRYGPVPPFLTYFRFDPSGKKVGEDVPVYSMNQPSFLHDFAITNRFAIFPDIQIVMNPIEMIAGGGSPIGFDNSKIPRIGILPKYARSESNIQWFDIPGFNIMHAINAWDEADDCVVLVAPNVLSPEHALDRMDLVRSRVEMVRIELRTGEISRTVISDENLDFGVIHPGFVGKKNRYGYLGVGNPMPKISGVRKLDFSKWSNNGGDCVVGGRDFGKGCFGGEPFFVPAGDENGEEDEGFIVSYVHDEGKGESRFIVMDSRSPEMEVVAEVLLPRRVPYGFHGIFLSEEDIRAQWK